MVSILSDWMIESDGKVPLELVESELKQELILQKAGQNFTDQERALSDALFDADNLSQLANIIGLEVMTEEFFAVREEVHLVQTR